MKNGNKKRHIPQYYSRPTIYYCILYIQYKTYNLLSRTRTGIYSRAAIRVLVYFVANFYVLFIWTQRKLFFNVDQCRILRIFVGSFFSIVTKTFNINTRSTQDWPDLVRNSIHKNGSTIYYPTQLVQCIVQPRLLIQTTCGTGKMSQVIHTRINRTYSKTKLIAMLLLLLFINLSSIRKTYTYNMYKLQDWMDGWYFFTKCVYGIYYTLTKIKNVKK